MDINSIYRKILSSENYSKILESILSLSVIRVADLILPLVVLPYIIRVIGVERYGTIAFITSVVTYFLNVTQYGFSLSAVRDLSKNQSNRRKLEDIFNAVLTTKMYLFLISFLIIIILAFTVSFLYANRWLYVLATGIILGDLLFPKWFFQGIEEMRHITYINLILKLCYVVLVFVFVKEQNDYILILVFQSSSAIMAGLISFYIILFRIRLKIKLVSLGRVQNQLAHSFSSFITLITPTLYSNTSLFLLGIYSNSTIVGYFSGAVRITNAFTSLNDIMMRSFYPFVSKTVNDIFRINMFILMIGIGVTILMFVSSDFCVEIVLGESMVSSVPIVAVLSLSPLLLSIRTVYGINYLVANNLDHLYMRIALISSLLGLLFGFILIPNYEGIGAAWVIVFAQFIYALFSYIYHRKNVNLYGA